MSTKFEGKTKGHHNPSGKIVGYAYCIKCGLVYLHNAATYKAVKSRCPGDDET